MKEGIGDTIEAVFDYLNGENESINLAQAIRDNLLTSEVIASLVEELDLPSLVEGIFSEQEDEEEFPAEFRAALVNTITEFEPTIKEELIVAADSIFDYLLVENQSIDLSQIIRSTFLNSDFVIALVNELDISFIASEFLNEQLVEGIPEESEFLVKHMDDVIIELESTIKEELIVAADLILDYLLGESQGISIAISLEPIIENLEDTLGEAFLELPPVELDETLFGAEMPAQIAEVLAEAEEGLGEARQDIAEILAEAEERLEEARQYVGYFQLGHKLLIGFIVLLIAGIVLLDRQVKSATRRLGTIFSTYGVLCFTSIFVAKYFIRKTQLPQLVNDFSDPLQRFSFGLLIGGVVLIVVSFVYPRWRQSHSESPPIPPSSTNEDTN
jgi:hypothetical protein